MTVKLRDLLQAIAEDPGTSGSALASRFGVTRAAIWKQVKALRAFGAPIAARAVARLIAVVVLPTPPF